MKRKLLLLLLVFSEVCIAQQQIERYAIISGVNNGGARRQVLRYAVDDAIDFSHVMKEMGGLQPSNTILLKEPSITDFYNGLKKLDQTIRQNQSKTRKEMIVYYSGHADGNGLLFGNQRFDYKRLRQVLDSMSADVKITILDACASGTITRVKGGVRQQAFLVDASSELTGYAFITSSSESELSQESDEIRGSFFTHFLISGLRGAADMSSDGKITLSEAYQFAFHETLAGTESTIEGPQHPSYDMRLTGSGDVVMTDIRSTNSTITFPADISGNVFIRNGQNQLLAELFKQKGKIISIGLPKGSVTVQINDEKGSREGTFIISRDTSITFTLATLKNVPAQNRKFSKKGSPIVYPHWFSGGVVTHDSLKLKGFSVSLCGNLAYDTIMGIQYSLFSNESERPMYGVQRAVIGANHCSNDFKGVQKALISNSADSTVSGAQISIINNTAGYLRGTQISLGVNKSYDTISGLQLGLITKNKQNCYGFSGGAAGSLTGNLMYGTQVGFFTHAGSASGVQIAPLFNSCGKGGIRGLQLGGLINVAQGNVNGFQLGSLANISDDCKGVQFGIMNIADTVWGIQAGFINISTDMHGYPFGLFNYSRKGVFTCNVWHDEQGVTCISLQSGTRNFYNLFTAGVANNLARAAGFGMGYRLPFKYFSFENDINHFFTIRQSFTTAENWDMTEKVRFTLATRSIPYISVAAGFSGNVLFNFDRCHNVNLYKPADLHFKRLAQGIYSWPGFHFGMSIGRF